MKKAWFVLAAMWLAASAGAEMKLGLKGVKADMKEQAGVVTAFDGAVLTLAVAEKGKVLGEASFSIDPLTQFKGDKKQLTEGRAVLVMYTEKGGKKTARAVAFRDPEKSPVE